MTQPVQGFTPEQRLGLHLGLTILLLQQGTTVTILQQQLIGLRSVISDVMALEPSNQPIRLDTIIPESVAEELASDVVIPNSLEDLE